MTRVTIQLYEAAGDTPFGVPYAFDNLVQVRFTEELVSYRGEITEGPHSGRTLRTDLYGTFDRDRGTGLVDHWFGSVRGDDHFGIRFDDPIQLGRLDRDLERSLDFGVAYIGNEFDNRIEGTVASDAISGRGGNDRILGGGGQDDLSGNGGNDRVSGGTKSDIMSGDSGSDVLLGGKHEDRMYGGFGADRMIGGTGGDTMYGEAGADSYVFLTLRDFGIYHGSSDHRDRLFDYEAGVDTIDLAGVDADTGTAGNQSFTWIDRDAFSGTAGELRWSGAGFVRGDVDGDGDLDFEFQCNRPQEDDLVL